ncbi:MAG: hypothetical protein AAF198_05890 [Pseudomonadota bacterium]
MLRRNVLRGLSSVGLISLGCQSFGDTGHGENGVEITIMSVGPDALDPNKTAVGVEVFNNRRAEAVLRNVETNYGLSVMHKTVSVFGNQTRSVIQFLSVRGNGLTILRPPTRQITIDEPFSPDKYYAFGFDFGPIGRIYVEWGTLSD